MLVPEWMGKMGMGPGYPYHIHGHKQNADECHSYYGNKSHPENI